jgi:hypothetical protein
MSMGEGDPHRPDYSRYIVKKEAKKRSLVIPLLHGHLNNSEYLRENEQLASVKLLQALFRSRRDRKIAEIAAKKQAFEEAKMFAINEIKKTVMEEFRAREAGGGVGKLKWDAQVRMKQAKMRTGGQNVSRSDTVMVLMEEAISLAVDEVEKRFKDIAEKEGYSDRKEVVVRNVEPEKDVLGLFGLLRRPAAQDAEAVVGHIETPRPDEDDATAEKNGAGEDGTGGDDNDDKKKMDVGELLVPLSEDCVSRILRGFPRVESAQARGETLVEKELRLYMAAPDPLLSQLSHRIKSLDKAFSDLRTHELLTELPSKRLLLLFARAFTERTIQAQLSAHFSVARNVEDISKYFKNLVRTDAEFGVTVDRLDLIRERFDVMVKQLEATDLRCRLPDLELRVKSRFQASVGSSELEIIEDEGSKIDDNLMRIKENAREALEGSVRLQDKYKRCVVSIYELEQRRKTVELLRANKLRQTFDVTISLENRQNWTKRLNAALSTVETSRASMYAKYSEVKLVGKEFLEYALHDAQAIVSEYFLPKYRKTVAVVSETPVDGRPKYCGRGVDGMTQIFEAHNITYRVLTDDHGIFNGSDEYAAKAGSNERIGSIEYLKTHTKRLVVPLIATVDYFGFRVLAVSKLQCEEIIFNDEGEVRKIKEDMVHGVVSRGDSFVNKNKPASLALKAAAGKLNLVEQECRGYKDVLSSMTSCSVEIKVYRGPDDQFFTRDFWLAMPPEHPDLTPHLPSAARGQSIFWRLLRPELVKKSKRPLSPNAFNPLAMSSKDRVIQKESIGLATQMLVEEIIPAYMNSLSRRRLVLPLSQGLGLNIPVELHSRGINIRHLGYMRASLYRVLPGVVKLYFNESFLRSSRDLRDELKEGDVIKVMDFTYTVCPTASNPFTHSRVPISSTYLGEAIERLSCGSAAPFMTTESNSEALRALFLAEMVARAVKHIVRLMLRTYAREIRGTSPDFVATLYCEYFNIITGSHPRSSLVLQEDIFGAVR